MFKERSIWESAGLEPWTDDSTYSWYRTSLSTPAAAIVNADAEGAYLLTDRSTLLRQTALGNVTRSTVFVEPSGADDVLMNSCHALYSPSSPPDTKMAVKNFLSYLMSERGQRVIATFGEQSVGLPLFAPVADGYARTTLLGGRPIGGAWRILAQI
jgi:tungstate transport system substrate-binding protein